MHCSPSGISEVDLTHKFFDYLDFAQFFQIGADSVLIEMNDVKNVIYNNFKWYHPTSKDAPFSLYEPLNLIKKRFFSATSEALGVKTVYSKEFITKFKVVQNVVSDNFYFDQNTVRSNLKKFSKI